MFDLLIFAIGLGAAITIHEAAHCYMADWLGDPTPRSQNRLNLDPRSHLDPVGYGLPLILRLMGSPLVFGWGRPSPFDPYNLRNPKRDTLFIALAGPVSNLILASVLSIILRLLPVSSLVFQALASILALNISLAVFNLLPVPPLDGSKVLTAFLSHVQTYRFESFARTNSYLLLIIIIFPLFGGQSLATILISPIYSFFLHIFLPGL